MIELFSSGAFCLCHINKAMAILERAHIVWRLHKLQATCAAAYSSSQSKKKKSPYGSLFLMYFQCFSAFSPFLRTAVNSVNFFSAVGQGSLCF